MPRSRAFVPPLSSDSSVVQNGLASVVSLCRRGENRFLSAVRCSPLVDLRGSVEIPSELSRYFHPPPIRGPVSLFRRVIAGVRETDLGSVVLSPKSEFRAFEIWDTATGTFRRATARETLKWAAHTYLMRDIEALPFSGVGHRALARYPNTAIKPAPGGSQQ